ncbi:MAG: hypothetical protein KAJ19_20815 [Gammaproteobacteria bacterium]|nr:hypothetical protein [Gammaproteobacteria bacterium]
MSLVNDIANNQTFLNAFKASMEVIPTVDWIWCDNATKTSFTPESRSGFYCSPCFLLKKSDSCDTFYLLDSSNYCGNDLPTCPYTILTVGLQEFWLLPATVNQYSVDFKGCCDTEWENILGINTFSQGAKTAITASRGDGCYRVNITISVDIYENIDIGRDPELVFVETITKTYSYEITIDCCKVLKKNLIEKAKCKLGLISCKINTNETIGKKTSNLYYDMYRLLNILWVLENFPLDCKCIQSLKCAFDKIKNC